MSITDKRLTEIQARIDAATHEFLPVNGHPDDDECTHRADGTDNTYCGEPEAAHDVIPNEFSLDLADLLAEVHRLRGKLADAWGEGAEVAVADIPVWRTWADLEHIPDDVRAVTDADGDRAEPQVVLGKREWFFVADPLNGSGVSPDDGPFTEVLENG